MLRTHKRIVPFKYIEHGVYGDLIIIYPKPYSIYLTGGIITSTILRTQLLSLELTISGSNQKGNSVQVAVKHVAPRFGHAVPYEGHQTEL